MARDTSLITTSLGDTKRITVLLIEIEDTPEIRYTNAGATITQTIEAVSRTFVPNAVAADGIGQDGTRGFDDCSLTFQDIDKVLAGLILSADGIRGKRVQIWEAWYDSTTGQTFQDAIKLFDGRADSATFNDKTAQVRLVPHDTPWVLLIPSVPYLTSCVLKFRGSLCQYAGADTVCTRLFGDCTSKSNTQNFMGMRFLPDGTKKYFWRSVGRNLPSRSG